MAGLLDRIADARQPARAVDGPATPISIYDWAQMFAPGQQVNYNGQRYQAFQTSSSPASRWYDGNSVVFACEMNRILLFSEARFQFQQLRAGRPGDLFGTPALDKLQEPWVGHQTRDLLTRAELDIAQHGNSYWVNDGPYLLRLDPSRVSIITERALDDQITGYQVGERLLAYAYQVDRDNQVIYLPGELAHYKPIPHRDNPFIGMSWISPCLPDIDADEQLTAHKRSSLRQGTSVPFAISYDKALAREQFDAAVAAFRDNHEGPENAGKVLHVAGGADIKTTGQTFEQLSFKATQGAGETRIAACAGVPPVIVGLSEGLASATYSNYGQARRRLVDGTMRPLWGAIAGALESVIDVPGGARLWYDDRDIPFLREDVMDQAQIFAADMQSIRTGIDAGYEADAVIDATAAKDVNRLRGRHTGLFSVQLQEPGAEPPASTSDAPQGD